MGTDHADAPNYGSMNTFVLLWCTSFMPVLDLDYLEICRLRKFTDLGVAKGHEISPCFVGVVNDLPVE